MTFNLSKLSMDIDIDFNKYFNLYVDHYIDQAVDVFHKNGVALLIKLSIAVLVWVMGRWFIKVIRNTATKIITRSKNIDITVSNYITSFISVILTIGLGMGILSYLGVQTTSFAALLAGAGLAIGTAWGGLLTHFSAGVFLQILRPFKVGDYVSIGGLEGTVQDLGLFGTTLLTGEHVNTLVGNHKVFSEIIKNYSIQPYRRAHCTVVLAHGVAPDEAIARLKTAILLIPNVLSSPTPDIGILDLTPEGFRLGVRPFCHTDHHAQVCFDTYQMIIKICHQEKYPVPMTPIVQVHVQKTITN
jgi:small conductance mechanosensitive channel